MSQKEGKFQSKSRFGGGKGKGGFKGRGKPGGGGFGKRFEGDRKGGYGGKSSGFGGKPRSDRDRDDRGSDRPFKKREWKPREDRADRGDRPFKKEWKPREDRGDRGDRPFKKEWKPREDRGDRGDRPFKKEWKPREDRGDRGDRPFKKEWKPREDRGDRGDRPFKKEWKPREDRGDRGDRPFKKEWKPREDRGDRGGDRPRPRRDEKPYKRYDDKPRFKRRDERPADANDFSPAAEATPETKQRLKSDRSSYGAPSSAFLYGVHAVTEALKNPKRIHQRLLCTQRGFEAIAEAFQKAADDGLNMPQVIYVEKEDIDRLLPRDAVHQDILLDCQPLEEAFISDVLVSMADDAKVLVLDQVTDPHNVGAILRSAAAFGVAAVVVQKLHAPEITGTVAKAASGAVEHVTLVREVNLNRALEQLKEAGFFCIGLAERGKQTLAEIAPSGKVAIVLGAEGDGLRRLVAENCDTLAKLPTQGAIGSLNVSNAAAVALYELSRK